MRSRLRLLPPCVALVALAVALPRPALPGQEQAAAKGRAWTLDEALNQLELHPRDPYLQYVAMLLADRQKQPERVNERLDRLNGREGRSGRAGRVDLFSLFSGALAVQESLQLDTMRGDREAGGRRDPARPGADVGGQDLNFKLVGLAMHNYHDAHGTLPTAVSFDKAGKKSLLSWRVHLLPYIEQDNLYRQFKLDEPWDSPHNKKLIARTPTPYRPDDDKLAAAGKTRLVAPLGDDLLFPKSNKKVRFADVRDGLSNTILLVEADDKNAVVWTKPDDLEVDLKKPHAGLKMHPPGAFLALLGDGSVRCIRQAIDAKKLAALFTRAGGEPVSIDRDDEAPAVTRVASLTGPTIKSHPWKQMLAGKAPDVGRLSRCVPEDFYLVEFRSLVKMLEVMDQSDLWGTHLFSQTAREASTQHVGERLKKQLAIETTPLLRPFYDSFVSGVAVAGSDLYVREGSDVTLLFHLKQPEVFKARMDGFLGSAEKANAGATRTQGTYLGVPFVHVTTADRAVHVYSAYPAPDLHVRSNSRVGFQRILEAVAGKRADGQVVRRLGDSDEFAYIRTLMPRGAKEEDGFVYLSDPFIRRLVGPEVKLTELRRMVCYNHLRMIGHAALMYRTEHGKPPASLEQLTKAGCAPGAFGQGDLCCPEGGKYTLSADGTAGVCSHHGHAQFLTPCCEIPVKEVSSDEGAEYRRFLDEYNQYWRTFFDPIALRIQATPKRYRMETIVLPLIDNTVYSTVARMVGGKPEPLDALPVPRRNIFSVAARLDKRQLVGAFGAEELLADGKEGKPEERKEGRLSAARMRAVNDLKQVGIALHNYHDVNGQFPHSKSFDKAGKKALLSWRVHILPYIEQDNLYRQFKLDEPWDSDHNKKLVAQIPPLYRPDDAKLAAAGKTRLVVPTGDGLMFPKNSEKVSFAKVQDGLSNTVMVVEAGDKNAVVWTKPDDLEVDLKKPLAGLAVRAPGAFLALFGDGSVRALRDTIDANKLAALFTRAGGEPVSVERGDEIPLGGSDLRLGLFTAPAEVLGRLKFGRFLAKGVGNQVALHVCDSEPMFDFSLPGALGLALGSFNPGGRDAGLNESVEGVAIAAALTSLNAPVYVSAPVQDAKVVDEFLARLDEYLTVLSRQKEDIGRGLRFEQDFYHFPNAGGHHLRAYGVRFGPLKLRLFWGRIGNGLYVATRPFILEDLVAAAAEKEPAVRDEATAHGLVRLRPRNWDRVRKDYQLGWAENHREACLHNLGPISSLSRALPDGKAGSADWQREVTRMSRRVYGAEYFCPEEGRYSASPDGRAVTCSVHGSARAPRQPAETSEKTGLGRLLRELDDVTLSLTFLEDGLHAVVTIERK